MTEKEKLFSCINNPTRITYELINNPHIVHWNDPYYAIEAVFSRDEIESMSDEMVAALVKLAAKMSSALCGQGHMVKVVRFDDLFITVRDDAQINGSNFGRMITHLNNAPFKYIPNDGFSTNACR